jgi:DNA invertase Pin-like site-specific DNA recombinase
MKYGYARTRTDDQTTALQLAALKKVRCAHIFEDQGITGATIKRPALSRCLKTLRAGDTLIVWKIDRLARSLRDLINTLDDLRARGIRFQSLTESIDTETPTGRAMWQLIGVLAELERSLIVERTRAGLKSGTGARSAPRPETQIDGGPGGARRQAYRCRGKPAIRRRFAECGEDDFIPGVGALMTCTRSP